MSAEQQRYDWYEDDMRPAPYGMWVEYDDYKRLKAQNEQLLAMLKQIEDAAVFAIAKASNNKSNER